MEDKADEVGRQDPPVRQSTQMQNTWIAGGGVAVLVFLAGVFVTLEQGQSSLDAREKAHTDNDEKMFVLMQQQVDRRFGDLVGTFTQGRQERMASDAALTGRIDTLSTTVNARLDVVAASLAELRSQISRLEGRDKTFDPQPLGRKPPP